MADDRVPIVLSPGRQVTDPDEAEALGLTVEARRMREAQSRTITVYVVATYDRHCDAELRVFMMVEPALEYARKRAASLATNPADVAEEDGGPKYLYLATCNVEGDYVTAEAVEVR